MEFKIFCIDYLLSNNHVNCIIVHKFDFSDEEVMAYYISFLKTLSLKLNVHTIHFFFNEVHYCLTCSWSNNVIHVFASMMNFSEHKWFSTLHWSNKVFQSLWEYGAFSCYPNCDESSCWQRNFPTSGIRHAYNCSSIYKLTDVFLLFI